MKAKKRSSDKDGLSDLGDLPLQHVAGGTTWVSAPIGDRLAEDDSRKRSERQ